MTETTNHRPGLVLGRTGRPATSPRSWRVAALVPATITTGLMAGMFGDWAVTIIGCAVIASA